MTDVSRRAARSIVELAHAVVVDAAAAVGVPVLVLKGLGAQHHGLQPAERVPADVDVLVPPHAAAAVTRELERRGWRRRPADADDLTFSRHSETLYRSGWSCDLDVHERFPGLGPDTEEVFRRLWSTRSTIVVAGVGVPVPGRDEAVLVHALHCLRSLAVRRHVEELDQLVEDAHGLSGAAVVAVARDLGALPAARPFLTRAFGVELDDWGVPDLRWRLLTAVESPMARRLLAFLEASWRDRLRVFAAAVVPPRETLGKHTLDPLGPRRLIAAYLRRLRRGVRLLPAALREADRARRRW